VNKNLIKNISESMLRSLALSSLAVHAYACAIIHALPIAIAKLGVFARISAGSQSLIEGKLNNHFMKPANL